MTEARSSTIKFISLTAERKRKLARLVKFRLVRRLMVWAILIVVPKHRMGVEIVIFNERRQVLLLNHVFHPEIPWGVPGGWLDKHEDPAACALRELREETGLTAVLGPVIQVSGKERPFHLNMAYLATKPQGNITLSNEIIEAAWTDMDALPKLMPFTHEAVEKAAIMFDNLVTA